MCELRTVVKTFLQRLLGCLDLVPVSTVIVLVTPPGAARISALGSLAGLYAFQRVRVRGAFASVGLTILNVALWGCLATWHHPIRDVVTLLLLLLWIETALGANRQLPAMQAFVLSSALKDFGVGREAIAYIRSTLAVTTNYRRVVESNVPYAGLHDLVLDLDLIIPITGLPRGHETHRIDIGSFLISCKRI